MRWKIITSVAAGGVVLALACVTPQAASAAAGSTAGLASAEASSGEAPSPTFTEVGFAHPVSLDSALTVSDALGTDVVGYHFTSDTIVGDFWPDAGMSSDEFLAQIDAGTGTAPEIVSVYVPADEVSEVQRRGVYDVLGADLPVFDAPDPDLSLMTGPERDESRGTAARAPGDTWQPVDAEAQVTDSGSNLAITAKYSWWGLSPFAAPVVMADHWGMEFQFDFYTIMRPHLGGEYPAFYGRRPFCGNTYEYYKDWAAASTRPYNWYAYVISGPDYIVAPGTLGLYGDFNDLSDFCTVSTIAVGMAQPKAMPDSYGDNFLTINMYPLRGNETKSTLGAIVQPVSRNHCEQNPSMPLMDCMGVTPGDYPGPGPKTSRMVLNNVNNNKAPNLCWYSANFGTTAADIWSCF
jgi:hypothetical protein